MSLIDSYWNIYRIRSYAEDAKSIREAKSNILERFDIAYFYAFFKALGNLGESVRQSGVKFMRRCIRGIDWKEYVDKNVSISHRLETVRLEAEEKTALLTVPGLLNILESSEDFYSQGDPVIAENIANVKNATKILAEILQKNYETENFLSLLYEFGLIKSIQSIGEEMSKDENSHLDSMYPELDCATFINIRPVLAHEDMVTINMERLEYITDNNVISLIDSCTKLIGK